MNHSKRIAKIKSIQDKFVALQEEVFSIIKEVEKDLSRVIQTEWDKTFPGVSVRFLSGLQGGCMTNKWTPEVYFYTVEELDHHQGKFYEVYRDDLPRGTVLQKPSPVSMNKLRAFLKRMSQETGIPCRLVNSSYVAGCLSGEIKPEDYNYESE